jgi:hypothetical protein
VTQDFAIQQGNNGELAASDEEMLELNNSSSWSRMIRSATVCIYLNSFQESTPDVDVQMQNSIKVYPAWSHVMGLACLFVLIPFFTW